MTLLLKYQNRYYHPPKEPFITYEDSDVPYLEYARKLGREAGRGEGRTLRDYYDLEQLVAQPGLHLFVCSTVDHACMHCEGFRYYTKHIEVPISFRGRHPHYLRDLIKFESSRIGFHSIMGNLRGVRYTTVTYSHDWLEPYKYSKSMEHRAITNRAFINLGLRKHDPSS